LLLNPQLNALDTHWISGNAPNTEHQYAAKTRYRQQDAACRITIGASNIAHFTFDEAQWAVTPGQSVVAYDGEVCLGGGIIQ
jgi:tRNA-specific 2-thiouridylase